MDICRLSTHDALPDCPSTMPVCLYIPSMHLYIISTVIYIPSMHLYIPSMHLYVISIAIYIPSIHLYIVYKV